MAKDPRKGNRIMDVDTVWKVSCTAAPVRESFEGLGPYMSVSGKRFTSSPPSEKLMFIRGLI